MKEFLILLVCCTGVLMFIAYHEGTKPDIFEEWYTVTGEDGKTYETYQEACQEQDFEAANKIVERRMFMTEKDKDYVFNAEMLYLVSQNTEEASNRVLYLLAEYQFQGMPVSPGGKYGLMFYREVKMYLESISNYNNRCNNVLSLAISQGNESLARKVVELFKQNIDVDFEDSDSHYIRISKKGYNNTDKDAAQAKYDEAVSSGVFK